MKSAFLWAGPGIVGWSVFAYLTWIEPPFLSYTNLPFPVVTEAKAGQPVRLLIKRCNSDRTSRSYTVSRELISESGEIMSMGVVLSKVDPGCTETLTGPTSYVLPHDIKPGLYRFEGVSETLGTTRKHSIFWISQNFEVKP